MTPVHMFGTSETEAHRDRDRTCIKTQTYLYGVDEFHEYDTYAAHRSPTTSIDGISVSGK